MSASRRSRGLFPQFEQIALYATSNDAFRARFSELSRKGDRIGMISAVEEALGTMNFSIGDHFRGKDEARARQLFQQLDLTEEDSDKRAFILSEALTLAPPLSELFFEILVQRVRVWCRAGNLARCIKDCQYFLHLISRVENDSFAEDSRIDVLLIYSDCCKAMGKSKLSEFKNHVNEAARRIDQLAKKQCDDEKEQSEKFKAKKAELLQSFLRRKPQLPLQSLKNPCTDLHQMEKTIPEINGKIDEFLSVCSNAVTLDSDEVKGRFLRATRNIQPGTVLIVDRPFSFSTDIPALHRNCLNCHTSLRLEYNIRIPCSVCQVVQFCSEECRQQAWNKFHKYECRIFDYFYESTVQKTSVLLAYRTTVIAAVQVQNNILEFNPEFLKLHENDNDVINIGLLRQYEPHDYKTVFSLETHCIHSDPKDNLERAIHSLFFAKCLIYSLDHLHPVADNHKRHLHILAVALLHNMQAINCNAYEIVENVRDDDTKYYEPRNVGGAIYTSVSLTNHSCYPNIIRHSYPCGTVVVRSVRFIPQGSEILDCYGQHFLENNRDLRRKLLAQKYFFDCQCEACSCNWPSSLPRDKIIFKCKICSKQCRTTHNAAQCTACGKKTVIKKLNDLLQTSMKKRLEALKMMYVGKYQVALPALIDHANSIYKMISEPSLEIIETQQAIIQCLNALSSTSI